MAKMTLKGVFVDRGEFVNRETGESIPYNNLMLVGLCDFSLPSGTFSVGEMYETVKIKNEKEEILSVFGFEPTTEQFRNWLGKVCHADYNKFGKVVKITFDE